MRVGATVGSVPNAVDVAGRVVDHPVFADDETVLRFLLKTEATSVVFLHDVAHGVIGICSTSHIRIHKCQARAVSTGTVTVSKL